MHDGFVWAPHLMRMATLPWVHRDPLDRLRVAQAMEQGLSLLTADATLTRFRRIVKAV